MSTTYDAVRNRAALFDFSSEGRFFMRGENAIEAVNSLISADLEATQEYKALNTTILDQEGTVQAIVWVLKAEDGIWIMCDPERREIIKDYLVGSAKRHKVDLEDRTKTTCCLAIIGPEAQKIAMAAGGDDVIGLQYLGFESNTQTGSLLCRLGYTGEFEFRFITDSARSDELKQLLLTAGQECGIGSGELDELPLLMLEMRSLQQRNHIPEGTGPIEAGLHWLIHFRKESFPGHDRVHAAKSNPGKKALMLLLDTDHPPQRNIPVAIEGEEVGRCVYAVFSPTLQKTIALAYIDAKLAWVGIVFDVAGMDATAVSAPLFITKTVTNKA